MIRKRTYTNVLASIGLATLLLIFFAGTCWTASAAMATTKTLEDGSLWVVDKTTSLGSLTIAEGSGIKTPDGFSLTMTINGIQKDILPGQYKGDIILTVSEDNMVKFSEKMIHPFRQALYIGKTGIIKNKSVTAAILVGDVTDTSAKNIKITSEGENFNGIYVAEGASYTVEGAKIDFTGNGGNDFAGYGAAVMSTGNNTRLVVDQADIKTKGVVRTAAIAGDGSNLIVKNSRLRSYDGVLPADYLPNLTPGYMWNGPWMLGIAGNVRTTSIIGNGPTAIYINSDLFAEGWGVLSTDSCRNARLFVINSKVVTQDNGYGSFADGISTTNSIYGCDFDVDGYGAITTGGIFNFGASTQQRVSELNKTLNLGLTGKELKAIKEQQSVIKSGRFGIMFNVAKGTVNISDGTIFDCKEAIFLVRGSAAQINVDGSAGVQLKSGNGIIVQMIDRDRATPRKDAARGMNITDTYYTEPYTSYKDVVKESSHDVTAYDASDVAGTFRNIELKGDFYNGTTGKNGDVNAVLLNMALNFENAKITGVISSTFARHPKNTFNMTDWNLIGKVTNTPYPAVNNGVIVSMDARSVWTVTGVSYLTALTVAEGATIKAPEGYKVTMTVDGIETIIKSGVYKGKIVLLVAKTV